MAKDGKTIAGDAPTTRSRVPGLLGLVVVALAYQQSPYVPAQIAPSLHIAVPILASLLLTQLSARAARSVITGVRAALGQLQHGELVLRLSRPGPNNARRLGRRDRG